jgi:hypothetical protein
MADEQVVSYLLNSLTCFVRRFVYEYPVLRPSNFTRSFDAYYAAFGMRGEYRHMVSERERYWLEMPLRYSLIGSDQVHGVHSPACNRLEYEISNEQASLYLGNATAHTEGMHKPAFHGCLPETMYMGSWHVPRLDIVRKIVCVLQDGLIQPQQSNPFLSPAQARHNALTSWFVVALALLAGPRPFEIRRIRSNHLDLNGLWLSLRGKPHVSRPAFRRIPLLPELVPQVKALLRNYPDLMGRYKLGLFNDNGEFTGLTTRELNGILAKAGHVAGMDLAPDFYSLRHRFRTDMLACAMPEHILTYLMGHESRGIESRSIYLERSLDDLVPLYCQCARQLAGRYGIHLE